MNSSAATSKELEESVPNKGTEDSTQKATVSPTKKSLKSQQLRPKFQLQLFNSAHRKDLVNIFQGLHKFNLTDKEEEEESRLQEDVECSQVPDENEESPIELANADEIGKDGSRFSCTTCSSSFGNVDEHRQHYRLDWHRYNVKRRAHAQEPVTDAEFEEIIDGLSSISGSDTDDEDSTATIKKLMNKVALNIEPTDSANNDPIFGIISSKSRIGRKLKGSPKYFFENNNEDIVLIYKGIFSMSEDETADKILDLESYFLGETPPKWAVIMLSGGHFAATIVKGGSEIRHKTFHSYTVRAKQGGGQGSRDAKSGGSHSKSAGASLRRYNEASFSQHIQELLESWKDELNGCERIFYRALSFNERILFSGKSPPLARNDPKLRTIPFPTKRPTHSEVKRVISLLSAVQVFSKEDFLSQFLMIKPEKPIASISSPESGGSPRKSKKVSASIDRARSRSPKRRDEPERPPTTSPEESDPDTFYIEEVDEEIDFSSLAEYGDSLTAEERKLGNHDQRPKRRRLRKPKTDKEEIPKPAGIYGELLLALNSQEKSSASILPILELVKHETQNDFIALNQPVNEQSSTFLHLAAQHGLVDVIWKLLELGSDLALKDKSGKYPYNFADNKEVRNIFRKFRASFPDKYDYQKGQVPEPLTEDMEKQKAEKKALLNKLKREKEKQKKMEQFEKKKETEEKDRFLNLSDREKRALAAEKRILGQLKKDGVAKPILVRCFDCGVDITGKVPFEYNNNVFCTPKCLATHRKKFPVPLTA